MIICDTCFIQRTPSDRQLAYYRMKIAPINQDGKVVGKATTWDVCKPHAEKMFEDSGMNADGLIVTHEEDKK